MTDEINPLSKLLGELNRIFAATPETAEDERKAYIMALIAVSDLAKAAGQQTQAAGLQAAKWKLSKLAYALSDLDNGHVASMLRSTTPNGRPPDSSVMWMERVRVVAALNLLGPDKHGMTWDVAAHYITTEYPGLQRLMTRGQDLTSTILRWRRDLDEAKPGTFLAEFSKQMIDLENTVADISAQRPMGSDDWRQLADNVLARI